MYKKREIVLVVIIIAITVFLAFMPTFIFCDNNEDITTTQTLMETIKITLKGEIKKDSFTLEIPYGYSYGFIIIKSKEILNDYSIIDDNKGKRYYEDTIIYIASKDTNSIEDKSIDDVPDNRININEASFDVLISLYGIGEKRANAIIEYREKKRIESYEELRELIGVSDEIISSIKEKTTL